MSKTGIVAAALATVLGFDAGAAESLAPQGVLRAVYLASNPAQVWRDPASGAVSGVAVDLANELGRRLKVPVRLEPGAGVQGVIDAVREGRADIGFLANDPSRHGPVLFSQTYLRNPQSVVVPEASVIAGLDALDRPGLRIGATKGDSIALHFARTLKAATLVEIDGAASADALKAFDGGLIDAFGASRLRLKAIVAARPGLRILPGSAHGVPQAIIVAAGKEEALGALNAFLDDVRANGFLAASIERAANETVMEPAAK